MTGPEPPLDSSADGRDPKQRLRRLVEAGTDIVGGAIGPALGLLVDDPSLGPVLGAASTGASKVLQSIGTDLAQRWLGPREEQRVGAVLSFIAGDIQERMARGEQPRTDGFFVEEEGHRSDAEEVAENVILKCQREPEEMKIRYLGYLFSNVVFDSAISAQMAHQLTKHAEQLTYRQYGVLKVAQFEALRAGLRAQDYRGESSHPLELQELLYEIYDLNNRGFISFGDRLVATLVDIIPRQMHTQGLGDMLARLLNVAMVPEEHVFAIIDKLT